MSAPIRVLHVVCTLSLGGIETWLMRALERADRSEVAMDFASYLPGTDYYAERAQELDARVHVCAGPERPFRWARRLRSILETEGPYDVVHAHIQQRNGLALRTAERAGIRARFAHSHNNHSMLRERAPLWWRAYFEWMQRWTDLHATDLLACSNGAGRYLFGAAWDGSARCLRLPYGIDARPFREPIDRDALRAELGIEPKAFVVGHVGRFAEQKNHAFLLDVFRELLRERPGARLLLVGGGELEADVRARARNLGIDEQVVFAGRRADVPALMRVAMDVLVMPSLFEGLPVTLIESQAAGLPALVSARVSVEVDIVRDLIDRLPLEAAPASWAKRAVGLAKRRVEVTPADALTAVENSPLDIGRSLDSLLTAYRARLGATPFPTSNS